MIVLYIVLGIIALVLIVAAIIGTKWSYEKSILINAPREKVWPHTSSLHGLSSWSPWNDRDPNMRSEYSGVDGTPGATFSWESKAKNVGEGNQTITDVKEGTELDTKIQFIKPFQGKADAYIRLKPEGSGTLATWGIISATPYPMNILKLFGVFEKNMNKDFELGLSRLKKLAEA